MSKTKYDEFGRELPDPTPKAMPVGFKRPETLDEQIRRLIRTHMSDMAEDQGFETFEEADDFAVEEDDQFDPETPFEMEFDPVLQREVSPDMIASNPVEYRDQFVEAVMQDEGTDHYIKATQKRLKRVAQRERDRRQAQQEMFSLEEQSEGSAEQNLEPSPPAEPEKPKSGDELSSRSWNGWRGE